MNSLPAILVQMPRKGRTDIRRDLPVSQACRGLRPARDRPARRRLLSHSVTGNMEINFSQSQVQLEIHPSQVSRRINLLNGFQDLLTRKHFKKEYITLFPPSPTLFSNEANLRHRPGEESHAAARTRTRSPKACAQTHVHMGQRRPLGSRPVPGSPLPQEGVCDCG